MLFAGGVANDRVVVCEFLFVLRDAVILMLEACGVALVVIIKESNEIPIGVFDDGVA